MTTPWYLTPTALKIIARLIANPPARVPNTDCNPLQTNAGYVGYDALALRSLHRDKFERMMRGDYDAKLADELLTYSADEVLAALFGCPDGLDWAHPDRAARRTAMAAEITEALNVKVAA